MDAFKSGKQGKHKLKPGQQLMVNLEGYLFRGKFLRSNVRSGPRLDVWLMDFKMQIKAKTQELLQPSTMMGEHIFGTATTAFQEIPFNGKMSPSFGHTMETLIHGPSGWSISRTSDDVIATDNEWSSLLLAMTPLGMESRDPLEVTPLPKWPPQGAKLICRPQNPLISVPHFDLVQI